MNRTFSALHASLIEEDHNTSVKILEIIFLLVANISLGHINVASCFDIDQNFHSQTLLSLIYCWHPVTSWIWWLKEICAICGLWIQVSGDKGAESIVLSAAKSRTLEKYQHCWVASLQRSREGVTLTNIESEFDQTI